jgi:hypothetical protein
MTLLRFALLCISVMALLALSFLVFPPAGVFHIGNIIVLALGLAIIISFSRGLVIVFKTGGQLPPGHVLALGICTQWTGTLVRQVTYYFGEGYETVGKIALGVAFPFWATGLWLSIIGGLTILTALGQEDESHPFPTKPLAMFGIIVAMIVALVLAMMWSVSTLHIDRGIKFPQWCQDCHTFPREGE